MPLPRSLDRISFQMSLDSELSQARFTDWHWKNSGECPDLDKGHEAWLTGANHTFVQCVLPAKAIKAIPIF